VIDRDDARADRVLSGGRASGPTLDRVWARLDASLDAQDAAERARSKAGWRRPLAWLSGATAVVAAALAVVVVLPREAGVGDDGFSPRGTENAPRLVASCGAVDDPCTTGEEIAVSMVGVTHDVLVALTLEDARETRTILDGHIVQERAVSSSGRAALPIVIVADVDDAARGLTITGTHTIVDEAARAVPVSFDPLHLHVVSP